MTTTLLTRIQNRRNQEAFTLLELLVGILILGILSATGYPMVLANGASGHDDSVRADLTHYSIAMTGYWVDYGLSSSASIHASAFKAVKHSEGNHFAVVSKGAAYCIFGYSDAGERTKTDPLVITESNASGTASCSLVDDPNALGWN